MAHATASTLNKYNYVGLYKAVNAALSTVGIAITDLATKIKKKPHTFNMYSFSINFNRIVKFYLDNGSALFTIYAPSLVRCLNCTENNFS